MKIEGDDIVFSSGRRRYANGGIIGIRAATGGDPDGSVQLLFEANQAISAGYDNGFYSKDDEQYRDDQLQPCDIRELAQHMIRRWQEIEAAAVDP